MTEPDRTREISIVDYGVGNLGSIANMLKRVEAPFRMVSTEREITVAKKLILPGVGAFDHAMRTLASTGLIDVLDFKARVEKVPLLGVCLGMQLLTNGSDEGTLPGFGWIDAEARSLRSQVDASVKVPHMGWNVISTQRQSPLLDGLGDDARFYFVHSYAVKCADRRSVLATTRYGVDFDSVIGEGNIVGAQFHPEKSHRFGMQLFRNFAANF